MKRAGDSKDSLRLKRRASSLFSIATIVEDEEVTNSELQELLDRKKDDHLSATKSACPVTSPVTPPTLSVTESCSSELASDEEGLYFDDDDDESPIISNERDSKTFLPNMEPSKKVIVEGDVVCVDLLKETDGDFKTGIVFESGSQHFDRSNRFHKERPLRVTSIMETLQSSELNTRYCLLGDDDSASESATAFLDDDDYLRVHVPGYMQRLDKLSSCNCCEELDREAQQYKSIYLTEDSVKEAKQAAASLCTLVSNVVQGKLDNGFAVIRPPGHHAEPGVAGGYCLLNNVAIAASYARAKLNVNKVLIVDWDVHHGNGTQSIFLDDPNVLYFSVHRWHGGNFFPFLQNGGPTNVGTGEGVGYNVNVGWTRKGVGDEEYFAVWERLLMPIANEFKPDLVLVSAGFDAAEGDLGECNVTPECFGSLTQSLMSLANGRVVCSLEGGYVRSILGRCVTNVVSALLDRESPKIAKAEEEEAARERNGEDILDCIDLTAAKNIRATMAAHQSYWQCLRAE